MKKILIVGAGGIGGVCAGVLKREGYEVTLVCKYEKVAKKVREEGLEIFGICGEHTLKMPAVAHPRELEGEWDWIFITTKATDLEEAAKSVLHLLHEKTWVVSMQNGLCEELLASIVGRERTIGCMVGWAATFVEPGKLEMTTSGQFIIGTLGKDVQLDLEPLRTALHHVVPTHITTTIFEELYSKLIINSCITSLGAVCGLYLGEMLSHKFVRELFIGIMREAVEVAEKMPIVIPAYAGKLDYHKTVRQNSWWGNLKRHFMMRFIGFKYRASKSSSLQSLERGKPTEVDFLNGFIAKKGKELGVSTPINDLVVETIKEIERGERSIALKNFEEKGFLKLIS